MTEKTAGKPHKKRYAKPQVTRVKLDIDTTVMGNCWSSVYSFSYGDCGAPTGSCPNP
jgi:hypothetical protein